MKRTENHIMEQKMADCLEWARREQERENTGDPYVVKFGDLGKVKSPHWYRTDKEIAYRRGYFYGYNDAIDHAVAVWQSGKKQPHRIVNRIIEHFNERVMRWRYEAARDAAKGKWREPAPAFEP